MMALRLRDSKDIKKSFYYVWYLGSREVKGVNTMPGAIAYLLERERLQEPFKVTLQVSNKGLKIIQTVLPGGLTKSPVKHLVPSHAVLTVTQQEDVVAVTLLPPSPAMNNFRRVHAFRCDSDETAELLGDQLHTLAGWRSETDPPRVTASEGRIRSNADNDSRRESVSTESSDDTLRYGPVQSTNVFDSLAAELQAKLGRGNAGEISDSGPILLPPRDYDTVHRNHGNLAGIESRRCLNQTIVGVGMAVDIATRSATSSGIGSDRATTPPYHIRPISRRPPTQYIRDFSSSDEDEDWDTANVGNYLPEVKTAAVPTVRRQLPSIPPNPQQPPECRSRSLSPQPRVNLSEGRTNLREKFENVKKMFMAMERAIARPVLRRQHAVGEQHHVHTAQSAIQIHESRPGRSHSADVISSHEQIVRQNLPDVLDCKNITSYKGISRLRTAIEPETSRPRNIYEIPSTSRDRRNPMDQTDVEQFHEHSPHLQGLRNIRTANTTYEEKYPHHYEPARRVMPRSRRPRNLSYAQASRLRLAATDPVKYVWKL